MYPKSVNGDNNVPLRCAGLQQPDIRWSKIDGALPVDHVTHDGTLIINQVSAEDAGVYECIATGAYRTTRSRMELFILGSYFSGYYDVLVFLCLASGYVSLHIMSLFPRPEAFYIPYPVLLHA